uniref:Uncharacterized protein n=1 Tax=Setaria digitata TaxID=48799 RepID=A0A915PUQ9_9BILA
MIGSFDIRNPCYAIVIAAVMASLKEWYGQWGAVLRKSTFSQICVKRWSETSFKLNKIHFTHILCLILDFDLALLDKGEYMWLALNSLDCGSGYTLVNLLNDVGEFMHSGMDRGEEIAQKILLNKLYGIKRKTFRKGNLCQNYIVPKIYKIQKFSLFYP